MSIEKLRLEDPESMGDLFARTQPYINYEENLAKDVERNNTYINVKQIDNKRRENKIRKYQGNQLEYTLLNDSRERGSYMNSLKSSLRKSW